MAEYSYEQYTVREKLVLELLEFARHQVKDMGAKASMYRVATHCVNRGGFKSEEDRLAGHVFRQHAMDTISKETESFCRMFYKLDAAAKGDSTAIKEIVMRADVLNYTGLTELRYFADLPKLP